MEPIGIALLVIGLSCAILWTVAAILLFRDSICPGRGTVAMTSVETTPVEPEPTPIRYHWLIEAFIVLMKTGLIVFIVVLFAPIIAWMALFHFYCWCQFRLCGTPMPTYELPDESDEATP